MHLTPERSTYKEINHVEILRGSSRIQKGGGENVVQQYNFDGRHKTTGANNISDEIPKAKWYREREREREAYVYK